VSNPALAAWFFLQVALLLLVCWLLGVVARRVGQPQAVAEMTAGVLLGPSLFGWLAPTLHASLFPPETLQPLYVCSQLGLALYMFTVGLDLDRGLMRRNATKALWVSVAGIAAPFALGAGVAALMIDTGGFFTPQVRTWQAVLFVGAAMSITAFPVLARIIQERGIAGTHVGTLALTAGALNDAAAWVVLALVVGSMSGASAQAMWPAVGGAVYALVALTIAQPLLRRLADHARQQGRADARHLSIALTCLALGAWFTEWVGIHAVLGAFVLGVAMPRGVLTQYLLQTVAPVTTGLLVPLFFVYAGLNTRLGLVTTPWLWTMTVLIFAAACVGKGVACWAAARASGVSPRDALGVGALMNARGLMELILLNIALERGFITATTFTIFALMALATTVMASPLFAWLCPAPGGLRHDVRGRPAADPVQSM
jgi:Kef-type K+ transport system membrane component KefB